MALFEAEISDFIGVYDCAVPDPICYAMVADFKKNSQYQRLYTRHKEEGNRPGNYVADHAAEPYNDIGDRWVYTEMKPAIDFSKHRGSATTTIHRRITGLIPTWMNPI